MDFVFTTWNLLTLFTLLTGMNPKLHQQDDRVIQGRAELNNRPIIGILTQELSSGMERVPQLNSFSSYLAASYVKHIESAGGRVAPILLNENERYYDRMATSLNGVVFPGGGASITSSSGYGRAGKYFYSRVLQGWREDGFQLPLWATCLGFEMLLYLEGNSSKYSTLTRCQASNVADPLILQEGWENSRLFDGASQKMMSDLQMKNITSNLHKYCLLPETFYYLGLNDSYRILSTNFDTEGVEYVSTVEHRELPVFGTQWHPEKAAFEWGARTSLKSIPHSVEAVEAAQFMANKFVSYARMNLNKFTTVEEEEDALIYNYTPIQLMKLYPSSFIQAYFFQ